MLPVSPQQIPIAANLDQSLAAQLIRTGLQMMQLGQELGGAENAETAKSTDGAIDPDFQTNANASSSER